MAVRGVWQLQKLLVCFCDHSGSSAGARDFVHRLFPAFQQLHPQFEISTSLVRGHHPHLRGVYANKAERVVDVKNQTADEIMTQDVQEQLESVTWWSEGYGGKVCLDEVEMGCHIV